MPERRDPSQASSVMRFDFASEEFIDMLLMGVWDMPGTRRGLSFSNGLMYIICLGADTFAMRGLMSRILHTGLQLKFD